MAQFQPSTNTTSFDYKNRDIGDLEINKIKQFKQEEQLQNYRKTLNQSNRGASLMDQKSL